MRILVTGGAGFVGSNLASFFKHDRPDATIVAFDNLRRRGSELALLRLRAAGVEFRHGDVRNAEDLADAGDFDLMIECSAEPSVHAGYDASPAYVINTNLTGTINCLEAVRRCGAAMIFLSTSRVYPIAGCAPALEHRGEHRGPASGNGRERRRTGMVGRRHRHGFPMAGSRSIYGATKLASELMIEEYGAMYGLRAVVNRCGVLTGPWQMGKVDQGFMVLWAARHLFGGSLSYMGFGGTGAQVRDILHVADLYDLVRRQVDDIGTACRQDLQCRRRCRGQCIAGRIDRPVRAALPAGHYPWQRPGNTGGGYPVVRDGQRASDRSHGMAALNRRRGDRGRHLRLAGSHAEELQPILR